MQIIIKIIKEDGTSIENNFETKVEALAFIEHYTAEETPSNPQ